MIQRVYERVRTVMEEVLVATDDDRIGAGGEFIGGNVVITSEHHTSGTDRCAEALERWESEKSCAYDIVINVRAMNPLFAANRLKHLRIVLPIVVSRLLPSSSLLKIKKR